MELIRFLQVAPTVSVHHGALAYLLGILALRSSEAAAVRIEDYADIVRVRERDAEIATAWLVIETRNIAGLVDFLVRDGHQAINPPDFDTTAEVIDAAHAKGIAVNVWTVDDPARIVELAAAGVDAIITNDPAAARAALTAWTATP